MLQPDQRMPQIADPQTWPIAAHELRIEINSPVSLDSSFVLPQLPEIDPLLEILASRTLSRAAALNNFHLRLCPSLRYYSEDQLGDPAPLGERSFRFAERRNTEVSYRSFAGHSLQYLRTSQREFLATIDRVRQDCGVPIEALNEFASLYRALGWGAGTQKMFIELACVTYRELRQSGFSHDDLVA